MLAGEEKILNPNCLCAVLMGYIKKTCGFEHILENLDLATEAGEVIDLVSKPKEYAKKYVESRTSYILVKVVGDENDDSSVYVPLLDQVGDKIKFSVTNPTSRPRNKKAKESSKQETKIQPKVAVPVPSKEPEESKTKAPAPVNPTPNTKPKKAVK